MALEIHHAISIYTFGGVPVPEWRRIGARDGWASWPRGDATPTEDGRCTGPLTKEEETCQDSLVTTLEN